jgi:hypothetical protein
MDEVALGLVFLQFLRFSSVNIIPTGLHTHIFHLGMNNRPVGGHSSETYSYPIDMNNKFLLKNMPFPGYETLSWCQ